MNRFFRNTDKNKTFFRSTCRKQNVIWSLEQFVWWHFIFCVRGFIIFKSRTYMSRATRIKFYNFIIKQIYKLSTKPSQNKEKFRKLAIFKILVKNICILFFLFLERSNASFILIFYFKKSSRFAIFEILKIKVESSELETLELDTINTYRLFWISTVDTFDLCLIHSFSHFLDISTKLDQWEISRLMIGGSVSTIDTDWLHLRYFPGYKLKIKIILWLVKRQWSRYLQFYSFQICFRCHKIIY